jgi:membrane-associated phospholipid phosphatase
MTTKRRAVAGSLLAAPAVLFGAARADRAASSQPAAGLVEPGAGAWRTWVLRSGDQVRLPAPPDAAATDAELAQVRALASQRDAAALDTIRFWDAGPPNYRWNELALSKLPAAPGANGAPGAQGFRGMALLSVAVYDALVAAWDSKYAFGRPRPGARDPSLATGVPTPASPSYPSEHAVAAGAAAAVLAYLLPDDAPLFAEKAEEAARSRVLAGVQYPSDVRAGLELGRAVAARVIERAQGDGSDAVWTGAVPPGPGSWTGATPFEPLAGTWRPWALAAGSQFRPGPPPAADSPELAAELAELKGFQRTFESNRLAFRWAPTSAVLWPPLADQKVFEHHLDANPPRAARVYALTSVAAYDAFIAMMDAKYAYWAIRPHQLDPSIAPLFPVPPHPSYPSGHAAILGAAFATLGRLFPRDAGFFGAQAEQMAASRGWAGLHFRTDCEAGLELGHAVARTVLERAQGDGAD